jgi:hypothetical protein
MNASTIKVLEAEIRRQQVKAIIQFAIKTKQYVNYVPLAAAIGVFSGGHELAEILGSIMEEDHAVGRPLSCSVVVGTHTNIPGSGFFAMAKQLGYQIPSGGEAAFAKSQANQLGLP